MYQHHHIKQGLDAWSWHSPHQDIVTIVGMAKLEGFRDHPPVFWDLWSDMLDKGHQHRDKIEIAHVLESLGAHVHFEIQHDHITWSAACLSKDVAVVYEELQQMLWHASFPEEEIKLWLKLSESAWREGLSEPGVQVSLAFNRSMYPEGHPLRRMSLQEALQWLESVDVSAVRAELCRVSLGPQRIVVVGDIDMLVHKAALMAWPSAPEVLNQIHGIPSLSLSEACRTHIEIADKANLDVRLGHTLDLDVLHEDFWPLYVGVDALGGSFSARLMRTVRDVEGLTYGVSARIQHCAPRIGGDFVVGITLAPQYLERGIESTRLQIDRWWREGLTEEELAARQRGLIGRHVVRTTKTSQIAALAQYGLLYGLDEGYGHAYPQYIAQVRLEQVQAAVQRWIDPSRLICITAGSLQGAS